LTPDEIEHVARKVYEQEMRRFSLLGVPWEQLSEEERDDLRYQVRSVLAIVEEPSTPSVPGLLGLPPTPASAAERRRDAEGGSEDDEALAGQDLWLRTGT